MISLQSVPNFLPHWEMHKILHKICIKYAYLNKYIIIFQPSNLHANIQSLIYSAGILITIARCLHDNTGR